MLTVRPAAREELGEIMALYRAAQDFMIAAGNPTQWGHSYPTEELIRSDIDAGRCYLVCDKARARAVFALLAGPDPTYRRIEQGAWLDEGPYLVIHRLASDGTAHGIFRCVADYCKARARSIRADTHAHNLPMQRQLARNGFARCGIIYVRDGSPRIAYQWTRT